MCKCPHKTWCVPTVGNYGLRDYGTFAGVTALCAPYGYYVGESLHAPYDSCSPQGNHTWSLDPTRAVQGARQTCGCHQCGAGVSAIIR